MQEVSGVDLSNASLDVGTKDIEDPSEWMESMEQALEEISQSLSQLQRGFSKAKSLFVQRLHKEERSLRRGTEPEVEAPFEQHTEPSEGQANPDVVPSTE